MYQTEADRREAEFCREQSEVLLLLARGCNDFVLREQLTNLASAWVARAARASRYSPATRRGGVS
jgi:hypothetical protein